MIERIFMTDDKRNFFLDCLIDDLVGSNPADADFCYIFVRASSEYNIAGLIKIDPECISVDSVKNVLNLHK